MRTLTIDVDTLKITQQGDVRINDAVKAGFTVLMSAVENQVRTDGWESAEGALEQITNSMWGAFHEGKVNWEIHHERG